MFGKLFDRQPGGPAAPGRSTYELYKARRKQRSELRAAIYLYDQRLFILSAVAGIGEIGEPVLLDVDVGDEVLGKTLCDCLLAYSAKDKRVSEDFSMEKWRAYKASGAQSAKSFENNAFFLYARTQHGTLMLDARPRISNHFELCATSSIAEAALHMEIGATVRRTFSAAMALRDAGLV